MPDSMVSTKARERVLNAALQQFLAKGYASTAMVDIESSAGLTPGGGGTYRHFPSKKAIFEAVVRRLLHDGDLTLSPRRRTPREAATEALALLDRNRGARQLLYRDLDEFPELRDAVADRLVERAFRTAADSAAVHAPDADTEAMAAVMMASLSGFRMVREVIGHPPLGVSDERFIAAWSTAFECLVASAVSESSNAS